MVRPSASAAVSRSRSWGCTPCSAGTIRCSAIGTCRRAGTPPRCARRRRAASTICSPPTASPRRARSSTSTARATVWLRRSTATKRSGSSRAKISSRPPTTRRSGARNIAAPKNAQRLHAKTPCAVRADHCYDCKSPGRICRALTVLWGAMMGSDMEVVLVNEDLGY